MHKDCSIKNYHDGCETEKYPPASTHNKIYGSLLPHN